MISIDEFKNVDLRIGTIRSAERISGSEKLLRLEVDLGEEVRQIVAGIGTAYAPESIAGKHIVIVANLEPRTFTITSGSEETSFESKGMLLAARNEEGKPVLVEVADPVLPGSLVG